MEKECSHPSDVIFTVLVIQVGGCKQAMNMIILQLYPYSTNANMHSWLLRLHTSWYDIHWPIHGTSISVVSGLLHTMIWGATLFSQENPFTCFFTCSSTLQKLFNMYEYMYRHDWGHAVGAMTVCIQWQLSVNWTVTVGSGLRRRHYKHIEWILENLSQWMLWQS